MLFTFCHSRDVERSAEFLQDLLKALAACPPEKRIEALETVLASALKFMDEDTILEVRAELDQRLRPGMEHRLIMDLIEGHLALRMIARSV
jgi:hypothetical protein